MDKRVVLLAGSDGYRVKVLRNYYFNPVGSLDARELFSIFFNGHYYSKEDEALFMANQLVKLERLGYYKTWRITSWLDVVKATARGTSEFKHLAKHMESLMT